VSRFGMPFLAELGPLASADPTIFTSFSSLYPTNGFPHVSHGSQLQTSTLRHGVNHIKVDDISVGVGFIGSSVDVYHTYFGKLDER